MASKKKLLTSVVALGTAAVLALGGTFAWQSINQTALNESSDDVNPGGRLHDDFDGTNKDVYVENFAEEPIFARIRLSEYFEVVMNYGGEAETRDVVIGQYDDESGERISEVFTFDDGIDETTYAVNAGKDGAEGDDYYWWTWTMGGEFSVINYYMPTFNMNKDSLVADINGQYKEPGVITSQDYEQYTGYVKYDYANRDDITTMLGTEIFDADRNTVDEVGSDFSEANLAEKREAGNITLYNALDDEGNAIYDENGTGIEHTAELIGTTNGLISMEEWLALLEESESGYGSNEHGRYWVYDTDGWVYWSSPIAPGTTTGLLLDKIEMNHVMDDSWYYKITVEAQFVTADDVGKANSTGFYQDEDASPSTDAETLLDLIGVDIPDEGAAAPGGGDEDLSGLTSLQLGTGTTPVSLSANGKVLLMSDAGGAPASVTLTANGTTLTAGTDYTYSDNGVLTLLTTTSCEITVTGVETQTGTIYANGYTPSETTPQTYTLTLKSDAQLAEGEVIPSQSAALNDTVNITLSGVTNPLEGYSTTNSAVSLFTINNTTSATANWTKALPAKNTEVWTIMNCGTLTLNYTDGTIQFQPQQGVTIAVKIDGTTYNGSITMNSGFLPSTGD